MRILLFHSEAPPEARGAVVALGNFDGIHRGHRVVFDVAHGIARELGAPFVVFTFEPHPRSVLQPDAPPFRLTSLRVKVRAFERFDLDFLMVMRFDMTLAGKQAAEFINEVLIDGLGVRHVVVGHDFRFGKGRKGTPELLSAMARERGFGFTRVEAAGDSQEFSSSRVRGALSAGDVAGAAVVLGHWWEIEERVRRGDGRGREIGFATANLELAGILCPARGIYAVWAGLADSGEIAWRPAAASFGVRPTFAGEKELLEVHVLDFDEDLYGRRLIVRFVDYIRAEVKFDDVESLKAEMARDCDRARQILSSVSTEGPSGEPERIGDAES